MSTEPKALVPAKIHLSPGVRFMMLGAMLFSMGAASIKMAGEYVPPSQILFARAVVGMCFCLWMTHKAGIGLLGRQRGLLLLRGFFGAGAFFTMIYAYVHLPLADATVIIFLHPVLVAVLAWMVLKERLPRPAWFCILASLAGVALVVKPGFLFSQTHALDRTGVLMAFTGAFFSSVAVLAVRRLTRTEHPATIMLYPLLVILAAAPAAGGAEWGVPNPRAFFLMLMAGIFMNAGQYCMTRGYGLGTAAIISAVGYLEIAFATLWGLGLFGEVPDMATVAGAAIIVGSTYLLGRIRQTG